MGKKPIAPPPCSSAAHGFSTKFYYSKLLVHRESVYAQRLGGESRKFSFSLQLPLVSPGTVTMWHKEEVFEDLLGGILHGSLGSKIRIDYKMGTGLLILQKKAPPVQELFASYEVEHVEDSSPETLERHNFTMVCQYCDTQWDPQKNQKCPQCGAPPTKERLK